MADPKPDPEIADASLFFGDEAAKRPVESKPSSPAPSDGYEVADGDSEPERPSSTPAPPIASRPRPMEVADRRPKLKAHEASSGVDRVWSRGAEWGGSLARIGLAMFGAGTLLYLTFNLDALLLWSMLAMASLAALIVLAYPIFITLERPVRITPEQAIKDYFGAFSHLVPHTKRMWLLLAADGKNSPSYRSFGEFDGYWKGKIAAWKADSQVSGPFNPFDIEVDDFKSDKSAGLTELEATYTARVIQRGRTTEPVAAFHIALRLVRGPDKMWYLESGTLP